MKITLKYRRVALCDEKLIRTYLRLREKYEKYLLYENEIYKRIFFSIMLMENYNRPWYYRILEYILFLCKKIFYGDVIMSLGIMQVKTKVLIGNVRSIQLAEKIIYTEIAHVPVTDEKKLICAVAFKYNPSQLYREEIIKIYQLVTNYSTNQEIYMVGKRRD